MVEKPSRIFRDAAGDVQTREARQENWRTASGFIECEQFPSLMDQGSSKSPSPWSGILANAGICDDVVDHCVSAGTEISAEE